MKKRNFLVFPAILGLILCAILPQQAAAAVREALQLCADRLVPSLFPCMVFSSLLVQASSGSKPKNCRGPLQKLTGFSRMGTSVLLTGLIAGYPTAAKTTAELFKKGCITKKEARRLLFCACGAGPAFIFGVIGALYGSSAVSAAVYAIHVCSALLLCAATGKNRCMDHGREMQTEELRFGDSLIRAVNASADALIRICGLLCLFSLLLQGEKAVFGSSDFLPFAASFTELAGGAEIMAESILPWRVKFTATAAAVSFGGLCVMMQTAAVISGSGLSLRSYAAGKTLQALLSALLAWPVSGLLQKALPVSAMPGLHAVFSPWPWTLFCIIVTVIIFLQFPSGNLRRHRI